MQSSAVLFRKALFFSFGGVLLLAPQLVNAHPEGYYGDVNTSSSESLRASLHAIIEDHQRFPYTSTATDTWDVLEIADENQDQSGDVITIYRNATYPKQGGGNDYHNREHA